MTGITWKKSACAFCPFNALKAEGMARMRQFPERVAHALLLEPVMNYEAKDQQNVSASRWQRPKSASQQASPASAHNRAPIVEIAPPSRNNPTTRQQDKTLLCLCHLHDFQAQASCFGFLCRGLSRVALIDICQFDSFTRHFLHRFCQLTNLRAVLLVCRRDVQSQQISKSINRHMRLAAFASFGSIIGGAPSRLRRRLQSARIENSGCGLGFASGSKAQKLAQIMNHRSKDPGLEPSLSLLIDSFPGREIVRHPTPRSARTNQPAQAVEDFAKAMFSLRGVFIHQSQIRGDKCPFVVTDITRIRFSTHLLRLPYPKVHNRL